jgi:ABC-type phosphate transport system substrate-binding protein
MSMKLKTALVAGAVAVSALTAVAAHAETLYGGGATLPAIAYIGSKWHDASPNPVRMSITDSSVSVQAGTPTALIDNTAGDISLFGYYNTKTGNKLAYCQTGSGTGKKVLNGTNAVTAACPNFLTSATGFAAPSSQVDADFAASDAPLSASEYATYITNKGGAHVEPVQLPAIAGSIAIAYKNSNVSTQLNLTDAQICQVFSGQITNWNQLGSFPSKPIVVVFRSDGSGTSFNFANHLAHVCGTIAGQHFQTSQTFGTAFGTSQAGTTNVSALFFPNGLPVGTPGVTAGFQGKSGNPAAMAYVNANDGAIGYGETADALLEVPGLKVATVNGKDPVADFAIPSLSVKKDVTIGATLNADGTVQLVAQAVPGKTGCLRIADPSKFATSSTKYPIMAVSYLLANSTGNGTKRDAVRALMKAPYTYSYRSHATTDDTGFDNVSSQSTAVNGCIPN